MKPRRTDPSMSSMSIEAELYLGSNHQNNIPYIDEVNIRIRYANGKYEDWTIAGEQMKGTYRHSVFPENLEISFTFDRPDSIQVRYGHA